MKKLFKILLIFILLIPLNGYAKQKEYKDIVGKYYDISDDNTINIYLFYSATCPHCKKEEAYLKELKRKYNGKIKVYRYEVTSNTKNYNIMTKVKNEVNESNLGVPFTVIGDKYILGYTEKYNTRFENIINSYLKTKKSSNTYDIPLMGRINGKGASIGLIAIILGFIDGFNPCAMWILLLLINMCLSIKDKKKMLLVGLTFIITSGIVYFLSMLGMGFVLDLGTVLYLRDLIAIFAIILGIYNLYTYYKTRKDTGCHVTNKKARRGIVNKIKNILKSNSLLLILSGTFLLAVSVNLIELACSLGFPTIFLEILSINKIYALEKIGYLLIYILFYLIDDIIILLIAIKSSKVFGISTKYNKYVNLIGGIIMLIMGILLIFKPEIIMLNF